MTEPSTGNSREGTEPPPWLPLLRRLTEVSGRWGVWKNADRAIAGHGDIDSVSPPSDRTVIAAEFHRWATENRLLPAVECPHLPGSHLLVAAGRAPALIELQLCETAMWRGAPLLGADDLRPMMLVDERGFRRLRRGSEGLLLLIHNGLRRGGGIDRTALKGKGVLEMLTDDPEGVEMAASVFSSVQADVLQLAHAAAGGGWDRFRGSRIELWALRRAALHPGQTMARIGYRLGRSCPVTAALSRGRWLSEDRDAWLARVGKDHEIWWGRDA